MSRRPIRLTIRGLLILVAIAGLAIWFVVLVVRREHYLRMAEYHRAQELATTDFPCPDGWNELLNYQGRAAEAATKVKEYRRKAADARRALDSKRAAGLETLQWERRDPWYWKTRADEEEHSLQGALHRIAVLGEGPGYHREMRLRFERAAARPWEQVDVGPPPWEAYPIPPPYQPEPPPD